MLQVGHQLSSTMVVKLELDLNLTRGGFRCRPTSASTWHQGQVHLSPYCLHQLAHVGLQLWYLSRKCGVKVMLTEFCVKAFCPEKGQN